MYLLYSFWFPSSKATFEPILIPLVQLFIDVLERKVIPYTIATKINRKYWGRQDTYKNSANILDDPIDGIEMSIDISILNNECQFN